MSDAVKALLKDAAEDFPSPPRSLRIRKFLMAHPSLDLDRWQEAVDELYDQRCPPVRHLIFDVTRLKRHPRCGRIQQAEKKPRTGRGKSKGGNGPPTGRHEYGPGHGARTVTKVTLPTLYFPVLMNSRIWSESCVSGVLIE